MRFPLIILVLAVGGNALPSALLAQSGPERPLIGVLDLQVVGGTTEQAFALSNQLRTEILKTGRFTVVDRSQIDAVLTEQALQQTGCTTQECAVQVGRILGIRQMVAGSVTRIETDLWQVSTLLVDVETAETLRSETLNHAGPYTDLLFNGMRRMAELLAIAPSAVPPIVMPAQVEQSDPRRWWRVRLIMAFGLGLAATYYGWSEAQATVDSNEQQAALIEDMSATTSQAEYDALANELHAAEDAAKGHKTNSDMGYALAALAFGLAAWMYFDSPQTDGVKAGWVPGIVPEPNGVRLTVRVAW